jgi:hypothetical protein
MPFYVQLAQDTYGNTGKPQAVVEATVGDAEPLWGKPRRRMTLVTGPPGVDWPWLTWLIDADHGEWIETAGPARQLTDEEWETLTGWQRFDPDSSRGRHNLQRLPTVKAPRSK